MLLNRKLFKPYSSKGTKYCQDECCILYNYFTNTWQMMLNGEYTKDIQAITLIRKLKEITQELEEKTKVIIFVNDLRLFMAMIPGGKVIGEKTANDLTKHPVYYETEHIQFRNFSLFHISDKGTGIVDIVDMITYLKTLAEKIGYQTINACRYTAGWMVKRICCKGIEEEIKQWNYDHKHFMNTVEEYNDMLVGCKTGLLKACKGIHKDVLMIDISSAYLSKFFQLDCFPIGRNRVYTGIRGINKLLKGEWFHVVIEDDNDEEYSMNCQDGLIGFYKMDVETYKRMGKDVITYIVDKFKQGYEVRVWDSTEYGKIPDFYLETPKQMYIEKQRTSGIYKESAKIITELVYGKALQKHEFVNDKEVYKYFTRPENFVRPEWSMIVNSAVRLQMAEMIEKLGGSYYHDTDGIETQFTPENARIVVRENKIIEKFNTENNLPLQLGTWKIEALHATITIIGRKQRLYIDDNGFLTVKIAGVNKKYISEHMKEKKVLNPIEYFNKEQTIEIPNGYHYVKGYGFIEAAKKQVIIGKDDCGAVDT